MATLLISVGSWPFLHHKWSVWCGIQGVGPGLTLQRFRTYRLDRPFKKRFKQCSKTVRLLDRRKMSGLEHFELCAFDGVCYLLRTSRRCARVVTARHGEDWATDASQLTAYVEFAQGFACHGVA